ncbi:hypothetical protein U0070_027034 [Myodes glareolus]|uniref:Uricase n=1 Tax=Myodes glareolus TaxID=447135 RepID=A0AAW0IJL5_MYOGA
MPSLIPMKQLHPKARSLCGYQLMSMDIINYTGPPVIHSGIKDLKVLKTTQSGFEGFIKDQFTTLPEVKDRCFATQVYCKWRYQRRDVDFEATWSTVRDIVLQKFAGPYDKGEYSPSVQKTLYDIQVLSLTQVPEIEEMEISLPNIHYFNIDMSKMGLINKEEVLLPLDNPYGKITGTVKRKLASRLWYSASAPDERLPVDASGSSSLPVMIPVLSLHGIQGILPEVIGFGHGTLQFTSEQWAEGSIWRQSLGKC